MSTSVKSIYVEDFQAHAESKIELAPAGGLTVIVGPTDSGKTALVRSLRLLFYNVPQGLEYIRVGRNMATVAVEMADGSKVARERSKSVNRYRVVRPGGKAEVLEGFGTSVPLEVQEATGVRTVPIGESLDLALNLSEQLDGPFLGNKTISDPARAKVLGKLAGTEEVDAAHKAVGDDIYHANQDQNRLLSEIEALDKGIAGYGYLPALAEQIAALDVILTEVRALQSRLVALEGAEQKLAGMQTQRTQVLAVLARWGGLPAAVSHVEYVAESMAKLQRLSEHRSALAMVEAQRPVWTQTLARWANVPEAGDLVSEATVAHDRAERLDGLRNDLAATAAGIGRARTTLKRWTNLAEAEALLSGCFDALAKAQILLDLSLRVVSLRTQAARTREVSGRWADLPEAQEVSSTVTESLGRLSVLTGISASLAHIHQAKVMAENNLDRYSKALGDAQSLYADTLVALGTCPLCGSKVDPTSLMSHIKEVA